MNDIFIIGAGGFGREVAFLIERINISTAQYKNIYFIDDNSEIGSYVNGYKVIGNIKYLIEHKETAEVVIAIGSAKVRKQIIDMLNRNQSIIYPNIIDPSAIINEMNIGKGNIICANNIFTTNYEIGDFNIINLSCTVGHDVKIRDFVTIYPGVNISGNVGIDSNTEIGTGTKIIQGIKIGENTIIGAGSVVIRDVQANSLYVGVPAKKIK